MVTKHRTPAPPEHTDTVQCLEENYEDCVRIAPQHDPECEFREVLETYAEKIKTLLKPSTPWTEQRNAWHMDVAHLWMHIEDHTYNEAYDTYGDCRCDGDLSWAERQGEIHAWEARRDGVDDPPPWV